MGGSVVEKHRMGVNIKKEGEKKKNALYLRVILYLESEAATGEFTGCSSDP